MTQTRSLSKFDAAMGWALPAVAALTPLFVVYSLVYPHVGQQYFFMIAVLLMMAALGVAWIAGARPLPARLTFPGYLILANLAALAVSVGVSESTLFSMKKLMLPLCGFFFCCQVVLFPQRRMLLRRMGLGLALMGGLLALYGIAQHFGFELLRYSEQVQKNNVISLIGHPNYLASVLGPMTFVVLGLTLGRRGWRGALPGGLLIFILLFCIMLARTRSVWLAMTIGFAVLLALSLRYCLLRGLGWSVMGRLGAGLLLTLAGLAGGLFLLLPAFNARINIVERLSSDREIKSRLFYWKAAIDQALEHKAFGMGYGMYDPAFWNYVLKQQKSDKGPYYVDMFPAISGHNPGAVHNEYLQVFCEQGAAGLTSFIALLGFFLYFGYLALMRIEDPACGLQAVAMYGGMICCLIDAFFSFPWRLPVSLIVFMFIMVWMYDLIYPQSQPPKTTADTVGGSIASV
jgi:O-antigen ligase